MKQTKLLAYLLLLVVAGCIDPYRPPEITSPDSYLVVNGFFNSAAGATSTIQLSRTQNLTATRPPTAETGAQVSIESQSKAVYTLREATAGSYTLAGVTPQVGELYRLHIKTARGSEYFSDYVPVNMAPPIDSVTWRVENDGVQINVNTHDPTDKTRYYRWDYESTWEYTSPYPSYYEIRNNQIIDRQQSINRCWGAENSANILTFTTNRLSRDVVNQFPLTFIPGISYKLSIRYSILVKQIAITQTAYDYYSQLAKITQNIGSIFDPQPSQITGNIRSATNPNDLVLGFFRVGNVQTKRLFINSWNLPNWPNYSTGTNCLVDTLSASDVLKYQPAIITYDPELRSYLTTSVNCVDCRLRGGVLQRPSFWD